MLIRQAVQQDAKGIAKVHIDSWKTTYEGIVPDEILDGLCYEHREKLWESYFTKENELNWLYIMENKAKEIVGFINGGRERSKNYHFDGEIYCLYLLKEFQRQGIGSKLMKTLIRNFLSVGWESAIVWVLTDNPSRKFYESYHPKLVDTQYIDRLKAEEIALGWTDLTIFKE